MSKYRWIYTTWPDVSVAQQAARTLVGERLCACANILPGMTSIYRWRGEVETAQEAVMILKTTAQRAPALIARLDALHPYEEACIIGLDIDTAVSSPGFMAWIGNAVSDGD